MLNYINPPKDFDKSIYVYQKLFVPLQCRKEQITIKTIRQ